MLELIFWVSIFAILYAYAGYPLSLYVMRNTSLRKSFFYYRMREGSQYVPTVTVIIPACDEEARLEEKLKNTLELDYPTDKWEIIVASDASTDGTDALVVKHMLQATEGFIQLVRLDKKGGKEAAQRAALDMAMGEIIVFTDVSTSLEPNTLRQIVGNFFDKKVGGVDGMSEVMGEGGESAYLKYENKIREWEAQLGSTVSFGGCLFAARKEVLKDFSPSLQSDFRTALQTVTNGYQAIIDRNAVAKFDDVKDPKREYNRKHRTIVRGINNMFNHLYLLNPFKYGLFSYQLFCHKVLKWLVPFFMLGALITNFFLVATASSIWWLFVLVLQSSFYLIAGVAWDSKWKPIYFKIPAFFLMSNMAILHAWFAYAMGERYVTWKPTER